tara:strand:- start:159 stop:428 length:270 start_codon:yes stop_codon:yes gene_type:complete
MRKKSYMNKENILKEGFFDKLKKMLGLSTKQTKLIKKSKEAVNAVKGLNQQVDNLEDALNDELERLNSLGANIKGKIKLQHYTLKDFDK